MARYGYGASVSGSRTPFVASGGAAPSGIPTATTTIINISSTEAGISGDFTKASLDIWYNIPDYTFEFSSTQWKVRDAESFVYLFNTLPNQTENYIPLTGWSPADTTVTVVA